MKLRVERDVLADAVAWAARTLPTRPPVPVLAGLLLEAAESSLSLAGFDYEVSARVDVDAEVAEPGRVLVSGRLLADICRSLPARPVALALDAGKVLLSCGSARFSLLTLPVEDYPALPAMPAAAGTVAGHALAAAVAQVAVAAGRDDTLPVLTGVRVEIEGESIVLAATDRYRLAVRSLTWSPDAPDASAIALVPARTLTETARALAGAGDVTLALATGGTGEGMVGFDGGGRRTTSRLLDGEFPKYRSLLPAAATSTATVETAPFIDSVKRVALVADRSTPLRLTFSADGLRLEAGSGEDAQASESMDARLDGEDITIAFNPTYLLDGLGAMDAAWSRLSCTTPTRPAVLSGAGAADGEADESYRYLLMPIRLSA